MSRKRRNAYGIEFPTGYSAERHYHIGRDDLRDTDLDSLEILCSGMPGQMKDSEIRKRHLRSGDYDANEMRFNVWVNGFLIQFYFELMGLHVEYDVWDLMRSGHCHTATPEVVSKAVCAVYDWMKDHRIEDICETFYEAAEQGIAWGIADAFTRRKKTGRGSR